MAKAFACESTDFCLFWTDDSVHRLHESRNHVRKVMESIMCTSSEKQGLGHCEHTSPLFPVCKECWDELRDMSVAAGAVVKKYEKNEICGQLRHGLNMSGIKVLTKIKHVRHQSKASLECLDGTFRENAH